MSERFVTTTAEARALAGHAISGDTVYVDGRPEDPPVEIDVRLIGAQHFVCTGRVEARDGGQFQLGRGHLTGYNLGNSYGGVFIGGTAEADLDYSPGESRDNARVRIRRSAWQALGRSRVESADTMDMTPGECSRIAGLGQSTVILRGRAVGYPGEQAQFTACDESRLERGAIGFYGRAELHDRSRIRWEGSGDRFQLVLRDDAQGQISSQDPDLALELYDRAVLVLRLAGGKARIELFGHSRADVGTGATVIAHDSSTVTARGTAKVTLEDAARLTEIGDQVVLRDRRTQPTR